MILASRLLFLFTESLLHVGAGSTLGHVDLPIQRERSTSYPDASGSGIKGALRGSAPTGTEATVVFGPDPMTASRVDQSASASVDAFAGALSVGDGHILLFPVRSLTGVFAWATSRHALSRFRRDAMRAGLTPPELPAALPNDDACFVSGSAIAHANKVVLEEYAFGVENDATGKTSCWAQWLAQNALPVGSECDYARAKLETSLVVLPETAFRDFLQYSTEVQTHVRLEREAKTVARGALWTEEYLPEDTLMYAFIGATPPRTEANELDDWLAKPRAEQALEVLKWAADAKNIPHLIQLGANETVGGGMVSLRWNPTEEVQT